MKIGQILFALAFVLVGFFVLVSGARGVRAAV